MVTRFCVHNKQLQMLIYCRVGQSRISKLYLLFLFVVRKAYMYRTEEFRRENFVQILSDFIFHRD